MSRLRYLTSPALALGCVAVLSACGGSQADSKPAEPAAAGLTETERNAATQPVQTETDANGGSIERIDVNGDHKPDVFKFYRNVEVAGADPSAAKTTKRALVRKELDVNFDQRIDIVEFYEGEPGKEQKVKEEFDLDFDGRVDETRHYKDGNVTLIELDLGFDGKTDTWSYFQLSQNEEGKPVNRLVERRRDTNGDGAVDVWEYYTKGVIVKIGTDSNGDGTPDVFTRVDQKGTK